ncbi:MAG: class I SAM-dependent methyltransferase [Nostoc sp.]|uniref:class I SAM-dependent methyltransferase n=1 Tax=Nostoc sp. TaxID=1180 RepID=UPI002FFBFA09
MSQAKENIRKMYRGQHGSNYHATIHSFNDEVLTTIARQRAYKLQSFISPDDTILEFGVGLGINLLNLHCKRRVGYDLSDAGKEICSAAGIDFTNDIVSIQEEKFSVILCHHVLEHVPDPVGTLEQIQEFLLPGGKLLLFVPFETNHRFRRFYPGNPNRHLFAWNVLTLGNLVSHVGFEIKYAGVNYFGYERRLAFLARYGFSIYRCALWILRRLIPAEEIIIVCKKNDDSNIHEY